MTSEIMDAEARHMAKRLIRRYVPWLLAFIILVIAFCALISIMGGASASTTYYWDNGGGDGKASTLTNWNPDMSGSWDTDSDLYWGAVSDTACSFDTSNAAVSWHILANYTKTITQAANDINIGAGGYSQAGGTFTALSTKWTYLSGNWLKTAGTVSGYVWCLQMTGEGTTITGTSSFFKIRISANVTHLGSTNFVFGGGAGSTFVVDAGKTLTLGGTAVYGLDGYSYCDGFENNGIITSSVGQIVRLEFRYGNIAPVKLGTINCGLTIYMRADATGSYSFTVPDSFTCTAFIVQSDHASNTITFNLNGKSPSCTSLAASTRGIVLSSVAGARITASAGITVSANGQLDATNIPWISCGTNWDSSAGTFKPGLGQVNMTATGSTKLAAGQYFYNLWACNGGSTRTLLSNVVVQNRKIVDGTLTMGAFSVTINGTSTKPFTGNGTWSGSINITSTGASYTIWTAATWTGTIYTSKATTIIYTGGQLVVTPTASRYANVTMKGATAFWAGSLNHTQTVTFAWQPWTASKWYSVLTNGTWDSQWLSSAGGVLTFTHSTWSHHRFTLDLCPVITSSAVAQGLDVASYGWVYMYSATANEAGTWSVSATSSNDVGIDATTGVVYGKIRDMADFWVNITITDAAGGYDWENWSVVVSVGAINLDIEMTWDYAGYLKMQFHYNVTNYDEPGLFVVGAMWNFGDGRGSEEDEPMHIYENPGLYSVTVALSTIDGNIGYKTVQVQVGGTTPEEDLADQRYWFEMLQGQLCFAVLVAGLVTAGAYAHSARRKRKRLEPFALLLIFLVCAMLGVIIVYGGYIP